MFNRSREQATTLILDSAFFTERLVAILPVRNRFSGKWPEAFWKDTQCEVEDGNIESG